MKKLSEVLGLKVMSIKEGQDCGIVQEVMVDCSTKSVTYLILKSSVGYKFFAISIKDVLGMGADYLVTSAAEKAIKIYQSKEVLESIENGFFLAGATVVSSAGNILGKVTDFSFDVKSGTVGNILLDSGAEYDNSSIASLVGTMVFIDQTEGETPAASPLDSETRQFLLSKTLNDDVVSNDGYRIQKGTLLTAEVLDEAEKHDMLLMLTLNV